MKSKYPGPNHTFLLFGEDVNDEIPKAMPKDMPSHEYG